MGLPTAVRSVENTILSGVSTSLFTIYLRKRNTIKHYAHKNMRRRKNDDNTSHNQPVQRKDIGYGRRHSRTDTVGLVHKTRHTEEIRARTSIFEKIVYKPELSESQCIY